MSTLAPAMDRKAFSAWYRRNRARTADIFGLIRAEAYYDRPIALRHPFAFYHGHIPAFSFLTLNERSLGETPIDERLEPLFERGIDPGSLADAHRHDREDWPPRTAIEAFGTQCDERVLRALAEAAIDDSSSPRLSGAQAVYTILEHEPMHHETLMYIIHRLPPERKVRQIQAHRDPKPPPNDVVRIGAGVATLGAERSAAAFGWDNEFCATETPVNEFGIQRYPVTNGEYLRFVREGGPIPPFWIERDGGFALLGTFEELPLPLSWPVYASHDDAVAYAQWIGARLPTEAEYHRAAFGSPAGTERPYPWGTQPPDSTLGNFDFRRYDPEPVDANPAGASAWNVFDLIGNGWEWTASTFEPFPGFEPMASYPQYSADFFDGKHFVMKGASPVTARELVRRSFRNWFFGDYPYMYAKFRLVY